MGKFASIGAKPQDLEMVTLPFGDWTPDLMALNNPGCVEALNVIPKEHGFAPFFTINPQAGLVLPAVCRGALSVNDRFGVNSLYAATADGLFRNLVTVGPPLTNTFTQEWTNGGAAHNAAYLWQFVTFGDKIVAIHPQEPLLVNTINQNTNFVTLGGTPPKACCGARVADFLVVGNLIDADIYNTSETGRIRWSAFDNIASTWTTDPNTQADFNDMPTEGGEVMAIVGREYGLVFQERIISMMRYVGLPSVFQIDVVEQDRGAISMGCVVPMGREVFFIAEDGFFMWNGTNSVAIGSDKINRYFFSRLYYQERGRIVGAVDHQNECIRWAFPVQGSTDLVEQIIYNYRTGRFAHALYTVEFLFSPITGSGSGGFDRQPIGGFDTTHTFGNLNAGPMAATIETSEASGPSGTRVFINSARPVVDLQVPSATVQLATRDQFIGDPLVYGSVVVNEINGECAVMGEGRYVRFRVNIPAVTTWSHTVGIDVWRRATGRV